MKKNQVFVVEGKSDTSKLQSIYPNISTIETNGSAINQNTLQLIYQTSLNNEIVIFTDPDYPGEKIRKIVSDYLKNNCSHVFIEKQYAISKNKVGVAETSIQKLKIALNNIIKFNSISNQLTWEEYISLNLFNNQYLRKVICNYFKISFCNSKTLFKRLNLMGIKYNQLEIIINDIVVRKGNK